MNQQQLLDFVVVGLRDVPTVFVGFRCVGVQLQQQSYEINFFVLHREEQTGETACDGRLQIAPTRTQRLDHREIASKLCRIQNRRTAYRLRSRDCEPNTVVLSYIDSLVFVFVFHVGAVCDQQVDAIQEARLRRAHQSCLPIKTKIIGFRRSL